MTRKSYKCPGHKGQAKCGVLSWGYNLEIILNVMIICQRQQERDIQFLVDKRQIHCVIFSSVCPIQTYRESLFFAYHQSLPQWQSSIGPFKNKKEKRTNEKGTKWTGRGISEWVNSSMASDVLGILDGLNTGPWPSRPPRALRRGRPGHSNIGDAE